MTIITSEAEFRERLHRAKLDVVQGRTYSSFQEVLDAIKMKNKKVSINKKELCIN